MGKRCVYCNTGLPDSTYIEVCARCGKGVWGEKMFEQIVREAERANAKGDLYQGSVSDVAPVSK